MDVLCEEEICHSMSYGSVKGEEEDTALGGESEQPKIDPLSTNLSFPGRWSHDVRLYSIPLSKTTSQETMDNMLPTVRREI